MSFHSPPLLPAPSCRDENFKTGNYYERRVIKKTTRIVDRKSCDILLLRWKFFISKLVLVAVPNDSPLISLTIVKCQHKILPCFNVSDGFQFVADNKTDRKITSWKPSLSHVLHESSNTSNYTYINQLTMCEKLSWVLVGKLRGREKGNIRRDMVLIQ